MLQWLAPSYLLLGTPILLYSLLNSNPVNQRVSIKWNIYNIVRQILSLIAVLATLMMIIATATKPTGQNSAIEDKLNIFNAVGHFLISILVSIYFYCFIKRGVVTSGVIWTYLCLSTICAIFSIISTLLDNSFLVWPDLPTFVYGATSVLLFAQSFWADTLPTKPKVCCDLFNCNDDNFLIHSI